MNTTIVSTEKARADYERAMRSLGLPKDKYITTQGTLRLEAPLDDNRNSYTLNLREGSSDRPQEIKLNSNDIFAITHIRLGVCKQNENTNPKKYANYHLFTNSDGNYFSAAGEADAIATIFNGRMDFQTDNVLRLKNFSTSVLELVPERGYIIAGGTQTGPEFPQMGPTLEERGFFPLVPNIVASGNQNNNFKLTLGAGVYDGIQGDPAAETNVLVVEVHGYLISNAAEAQLRNRVY